MIQKLIILLTELGYLPKYKINPFIQTRIPRDFYKAKTIPHFSLSPQTWIALKGVFPPTNPENKNYKL